MNHKPVHDIQPTASREVPGHCFDNVTAFAEPPQSGLQVIIQSPLAMADVFCQLHIRKFIQSACQQRLTKSIRSDCTDKTIFVSLIKECFVQAGETILSYLRLKASVYFPVSSRP